MEAFVIEHFEKDPHNVENHNHHHKRDWQAVNEEERDSNDDETFEDKNCVHDGLFPIRNQS